MHTFIHTYTYSLVVICANLDELWEMPSIPLLDAHREGVDVLK
jgi:hypothetical protein